MGHPTPCFLWDRHLGSAAPRRLGKLQFTLVEIGLFFPSKWVINHQKNFPRALGGGWSHFSAHIQRTRPSAMKPSASCQGPMSKQLSPLGISKHWV